MKKGVAILAILFIIAVVMMNLTPEPQALTPVTEFRDQHPKSAKKSTPTEIEIVVTDFQATLE